MQFHLDDVAKLMRVEPLRAIEAPFGKLWKLITFCEQPPPGVDVHNAKILKDGHLFDWRLVAAALRRK